jgi:hypothetical protein
MGLKRAFRQGDVVTVPSRVVHMSAIKPGGHQITRFSMRSAHGDRIGELDYQRTATQCRVPYASAMKITGVNKNVRDRASTAVRESASVTTHGQDQSSGRLSTNVSRTDL